MQLTCSFFQDFTQQPPAQELIARDLHDVEWKFRHIFRGLFFMVLVHYRNFYFLLSYERSNSS